MARAAKPALAPLLLLLLGSCAAGPMGDWATGTAVAFGGPQDGKDPHTATGGLLEGSCGYGELDLQAWPHWSAVAISPVSALATNVSRHPLQGCGTCVELRCDPRPGFEGHCPNNTDSSSSLIALVTDTCRNCGSDKLTLHYLAFQQKLASPDAGEVGIRYRLVECPAPGGIVADIDTYRATQGGYLRLSLENVAGTGAIQGIELRKSPLAGDRMSLAGTAWSRMANSWGAKWELSGLPDTPMDMRITSDTGEVLVARQAITPAGATGKLTLPVQFSTAEAAVVRDAVTNSTIVPSKQSTCNDTILAFLLARPELSQLVQYLKTAGMDSLLEQPTQTITLFAPTNLAWQKVDSTVDLSDMETLQQVLTFLVAQGAVVVPDSSELLPEDLESGGISVRVDTLNGARLQVFAGTGGIALRDGSPFTPDAIIVSANNQVCTSVINIVGAVPMPFA